MMKLLSILNKNRTKHLDFSQFAAFIVEVQIRLDVKNNKMEPHMTYHWCLHVVVRAYFKFTFQNFFETVFPYTTGYFFVLGLYISTVLSCLYTFLYYDTATSLHSIALLGGYTLVCDI